MPESQKIRVNFKSYDAEQLQKTVGDVMSILRRTGANVVGPIPLPTKTSRVCVLRSPHVNKKSREQFEVRTHKRLIYITETTPQTMDSLSKLDVSAGVNVDIQANS